MNQLSAIATFYRDGGMFMHAILAMGVIILAIVVERSIVIGRAAALNSRKFTDDLLQSVGRNDLNAARQLANRFHTPVAKVAQAMLQVGAADEAALQAAADDAATLALPQLVRRLPHLGVLANSATLLGLLGTIFGLMTAFSGVGVADPSQRSAFLAAGISEALNTTAFGLIVAVPTLLLQGWLSGRVEAIAEHADEIGIRLSRALSHAHVGRGAAQVTPIQGSAASADEPRVARAAGAHGGR